MTLHLFRVPAQAELGQEHQGGGPNLGEVKTFRRGEGSAACRFPASGSTEQIRRGELDIENSSRAQRAQIICALPGLF